MKHYKEFTFGSLIFAFILPIQMLMAYLYANGLGDRPLDTNGFLVINGIFLLTYLLFYGLTTTLTADAITVFFGIGLIRRKIPLSRIRAVAVVKNPWYYGWGIRWIPGGMLYNISGTRGVELTFNDTKRVVRIGSKDPLLLAKEIEQRLRR